ncbi:MAG: alpha/beta fold hydrolase [Gemmatimonadaceae bacterium]|nr:alpha/beta fold hydrolase [Gemmatimonadaceae bacterium]
MIAHTESVVMFGPAQSLVGVLTMPDTRRVEFVVLLSNTGMNTRVGPFRLNVKLARAFARAGIPTFRFDRSGLGDSAMRTTPGSDHHHALQDTADAMDVLETAHGLRRCVLVALCSGVDVAHATTLRDPRVVGAVFMDGYAYPTPGFLWRRGLPRLLDSERIRRSLRWRRHRAQYPEFFAEAPAGPVFTREIPSLEQFRADIRAMVARGTRVLMVYTGGMAVHINAPQQLYEMIGTDVSPNDVAVAWMPEADHLFSSDRARRALQAKLLTWIERLTG